MAWWLAAFRIPAIVLALSSAEVCHGRHRHLFARIRDGGVSAIDQLSNGNIATVAQVFGPVLTVTTAAGVPIKSVGVPGSTGVSFQHDVTALSGGGFWVVVSEVPFAIDDHDIVVDFGNSSGNFTGGFNATASINEDAFNPSAAGLDNGKVAVAWKDSFNNITFVIYDSLGSVIKAPAPAGTADLFSQPSLTATAGGFALAYPDSSWGTGGFDITLLRTSNVSNPNLSTISGTELQPAVARLSNGFLAVAYKARPPASRISTVVIDTHVKVVDPATGKVLVTRNILGGEPAN